MEETPYLEGSPVGAENDSMSLRRLPRPAKKILLFLDREGTNRERGEMEREDIHWIHSFIAGRREQRAHACVKSRRERWIDGRCKRQREEGRGTNRALILIVSLPSSLPPRDGHRHTSLWHAPSICP